MASTSWLPTGGQDYGVVVLGTGMRPRRERIHDLTTSIETDIPFTATRVFVAYKLNSAFTGSVSDLLKPGFASRFDVQVMQRLPFLF